jgi:carotenoid cleavage dioxygenase-like enzyme
MAARFESDRPFFLSDNYAPVAREVSATDLPVTGAIPTELAGQFLRNGPNPSTGSSPHWFLGDGMLHGIDLRDGQARGYRNRYVRTRQLSGDGTFVDENGQVDLTVGAANTHVIGHAGRILALVESGFPYEVTPDLETVGPFDFDGQLTTAMTAHPKVDPATGELHFFGYGFLPPYLTYHVADADGRLVHSEEISVPVPTMMHDFNLTEHHVVFMDLPVVFDLDLAMQETFPYRWDEQGSARLGVLPRRGHNADVQWLDIEPCYVFHPLNAYEDDGQVVLDVMRYRRLWDRSRDEFDRAHLTRWTVDPGAGTVKEEQLDDRATEFPRVDPRLVGRRHRFGYALETGDGIGAEHMMLVKYDVDTGTTRGHDFGAGREPGEPVFVPRSADAAEDDGWVMTYVYDAARDTSDFVILAAQDFGGPPVATVPLPQRVPFGFHGSWIPEPGEG